MSTVVNLDGRLVPPERAAISIFDRGFLYGDSVYEVVRTYGGRPFELPAHLARLRRSAERLRLPLPWGEERTRIELLRTLAEVRGEPAPADPDAAPWNVGERSLRVVMTRGAGELGLDPALAVSPVAIVISTLLRAPPARAYAEGVACRVVGIRHDDPDAPDTTAKTGAHLGNVLALAEARRGGAHEALLLDREGFVTEGASSNVFVVRGGRVETPPLSAGILEGVTRGLVITLARKAGIPEAETALRPADLASADELFVTSTAREVLPVTSLNGEPVGAGTVGPLTARLHALFRARAGAGGPGESARGSCRDHAK